MKPLDLLTAWLERQTEPQAMAWLADRRAALRAQPDARTLAIALGFAPRKVGKGLLALTADDLARAEQTRPGWRPQGLTTDQAARIVLVLEAAGAAPDFPALLKAVLSTADLAEQIAVQRGLPLYPHPETLTLQAIETLRSAVRGVFESVAHDNPFPAEQFTQDAWNQMVLKTLFVGSILDPIVGLDTRWNERLARTLIDYADERTAAGRPISPELWRGVAPFADDVTLDRIAGFLASNVVLEQQAAALALHAAGETGQQRLQAERPDLADAIAAGEIGWKAIGDRLKSA